VARRQTTVTHYGRLDAGSSNEEPCRQVFRTNPGFPERTASEDLNAQLDDWLATVANVRLHGTTQRIVAEAFAAEQLELQSLPVVPFDELLKLEPRVSHDGLVSIGGNYYSVPDRTRRIVEAASTPSALSQGMDYHWPSNRCSWSREQRRRALLNPGQRSPV
jgi:hypothetical protein